VEAGCSGDGGGAGAPNSSPAFRFRVSGAHHSWHPNPLQDRGSKGQGPGGRGCCPFWGFPVARGGRKGGTHSHCSEGGVWPWQVDGSRSCRAGAGAEGLVGPGGSEVSWELCLGLFLRLASRLSLSTTANHWKASPFTTAGGLSSACACPLGTEFAEACWVFPLLQGN